MEKKSTRIAYFVALGIFIVLLVVLGISYKDAAKISKKHAKIGEKGENRIHNLFKITRLWLC